MLGKIFGKKEEKFFASLPDNASEAITDALAAVAPALVEKLATAPETGLDKAGVAVAEGEAMAIAPESTAPVPTGTVFSDTKAIIAAALKANSEEMAAAAAAEVGSVFAEEYLVVSGNKSNRRSPGASMAAFMDMAKNIKS